MKTRFVMLGALAAMAALVACGGGGGGGGGVTPATSPTVTPTGTGTAAPVSQTITFTGSTQKVGFPANPVGATGSVTVPSGNGTVTFTYSQEPLGASSPNPPEIMALHRSSASVASVKRVHVQSSSATSNTGVLYVTISTTGTATMNGVPGFSVTLPSSALTGIPAGSQFYVAYYGSQTNQNPAAQSPAWVSASQSAATLSGTTLTIPAASTPQFTIDNGNDVYLVVYYGYFIPAINTGGCVGAQGDEARRELVGVEPPTSGSTWTYTGSLSSSIDEQAPCPIPTATANANVTVNVSVTSTPGMPAGYADEQSIETDVYATNQTQVTTNAIVKGQYESSETSTDLSNNQVVTTYGGSGLEYYSANQGFTNAPPASVNTAFADGSTYQRNYASNGNGAYTENDTVDGATGTISVSANGAAAYNIPQIPADQVPAVTMGAPTDGQITVTFNGTPLAVPVWYTFPLYSDATTVASASTTVPSTCGSAAGITGADEYVRTIKNADPALGTLENETITTWVEPNYSGTKTVGPVCVSINDVQELFYDFLLNTTAVYVSGGSAPLQTSTYNETYAFSSAPVGESVGRPRSVAQSASTFALHQSGLAFARTFQRAQRLETLERAAATGHLKGVIR